MISLAKTLVLIGVVLIILGGAVYLFSRFNIPLGRLGEPVREKEMCVHRAINQTGLVGTGRAKPGAKVGVGDLQGVIDELSLAGGSGLGEFEYDVMSATTIVSERLAALFGVSLVDTGEWFPAGQWANWVHPDDLPGVRLLNVTS